MIAQKKAKRKPVDKETFQIPRKSTAILSDIAAGARKANGVVIRKQYVLMGLLDLLESADIDPKAVKTEADIIQQLKEHIRKGGK